MPEPTPAPKPVAFNWNALADAAHAERIFGASLGFVSGFVDTAGFIMLFELFTAHITGNLIVAAARIAHIDRDVTWIRLATIGIFVLSIIISTVFSSWLRKRNRSPIRWLLWCEALALACFGLIGTDYGAEVVKRDEWLLLGVASLAVVAMGIHITINKQTTYAMGLTNVMTNNLTMLTIDLTQITLHHLGHSPVDDIIATQSHRRILSNVCILLGFLAGVITAGLTIPQVGYAAIGLPLVVVVLLAVTCRDQPESPPRGP